MPAKTFTCSICQATVTKPTSYALADGTRACRSHDEATGAHAAREEQRRRDHAAAIEQVKRGAERLRTSSRAWGRDFDPSPRCFCCNKPGVRQQEFYSQMLVAMEAADMSKSDPTKREIAQGMLPDKPVLMYVNVPEDKRRRLHFHSRMACDVLQGLAMLCRPCIDKLGLESITGKLATGEALQRMGAFYDVFLRPSLRAAAEGEINKRQRGAREALDTAVGSRA